MTKQAPARAWRRYLSRLALTCLLLAGLIAVVDTETLGSVLGRLGLVAFILATLLHVAGSIVVPAVVTYLSTRGTSMEVRLGRAILINLSIRFYTMVLPRATATGIRWMKYRRTSDGSHAAALVVLEKLVQVFIYSLIAGLMVIVETPRLGSSAVALLLLCGAGVVSAGLGLVATFSPALDPLFARWTLTRSMPAIDQRLQQLAAAVRTQRTRSFLDLVRIAGWSIAGFSFFVLSAWVVVGELDVPLSLAGLVWIRGVVFLGTLIPVTIAGAGVREAGFVGFTQLYGVDSATALGLALALLGLQIAIGAAGALVELYDQVTSLRSAPPVLRERKQHVDV